MIQKIQSIYYLKKDVPLHMHLSVPTTNLYFIKQCRHFKVKYLIFTVVL